MKKSFLKVVSNLSEQTAQIFLYGIIGDYWTDSPLTAKAFVRSLTTLEGQGVKRVNVRLNGPGGDVWEGLGILNAILTSKMEVHTYNDGICASMHGVILAAPKDKAKRHAAKASVTMIHNASTIAWGNSQQMRETADFLDTHDLVLAGVFADATGQTTEQIQASYLDYKDHWLTSQQAEAMGLFTIEDYDVQDVPTDIQNMSLNQVAALYSENSEESGPSFIERVGNAVKEILNLKNQTIDMKFPKMEALAKVAPGDLTQEAIDAVNTEIAESEIEGVRIVLDSEQVTLEESALQATVLFEENGQLTTQNQTLTNRVVELEAIVNKPAEESGAAGAVKDTIQGTEKKSAFNLTSVDAEKAKIIAEWGVEVPES